MPNANGTFQFYKFDNAAKDFNTSFQVNDTGLYYFVIPQLTHGWWSVNVSWNVDSKVYFTKENFYSLMNENTFYFAALLLGFLGSFHCVGMYGPIAPNASANKLNNRSVAFWQNVLQHWQDDNLYVYWNVCLDCWVLLLF